MNPLCSLTPRYIDYWLGVAEPVAGLCQTAQALRRLSYLEHMIFEKAGNGDLVGMHMCGLLRMDIRLDALPALRKQLDVDQNWFNHLKKHGAKDINGAKHIDVPEGVFFHPLSGIFSAIVMAALPADRAAPGDATGTFVSSINSGWYKTRSQLGMQALIETYHDIELELDKATGLVPNRTLASFPQPMPPPAPVLAA